MSSAEFLAIRHRLRLTRAQLGRALGLSENGHRTIVRIEADGAPVSGPMALAMCALASGWRPDDWVARIAGGDALAA